MSDGEARAGTLKLSLPDIPLKGGDNKVMMRFDIGAKASVPDEHDSVLFFELRHKIKGKEQVGLPPS